MMWRREQIRFVLEMKDTDWPVATLRVLCPAGDLLIMGVPVAVGGMLRVRGAHTHGADGSVIATNAISTANLQVIAQAFLEVFDYDELVVEGSLRTSGRRKGKIPRPFRFIRHGESPMER